MRVSHLTPTLEIRGPGPRAAVRGWIEWTLIGRDGKVKQAGEQHNLILNKGLDRVMSTLHSTNAGTDRLDGMIRYMAVGTGSNAPAVTDTALQSEVARTSDDLGLGGYELTRLANGLWRISLTRAFDYNQANGNLTEFGGSESSSSASGVNTRELFRDGSNNPIVITKTSNERLAITYHLEIQLSPVVDTQAADINIVGLGTKQVSHLWVDNGDYIADDLAAWLSYLPNGIPLTAMGMYTSSLTGAMVYSNSGAPNGSNNFTHYGAWLSYANGTYYRDYEGERGPEASDVNIYGYGYGCGNAGGSNVSNRMGWKARFGVAGGAEAPILKNKDYRLKLAFRFSLARA